MGLQHSSLEPYPAGDGNGLGDHQPSEQGEIQGRILEKVQNLSTAKVSELETGLQTVKNEMEQHKTGMQALKGTIEEQKGAIGGVQAHVQGVEGEGGRVHAGAGHLRRLPGGRHGVCLLLSTPL